MRKTYAREQADTDRMTHTHTHTHTHAHRHVYHNTRSAIGGRVIIGIIADCQPRAAFQQEG